MCIRDSEKRSRFKNKQGIEKVELLMKTFKQFISEVVQRMSSMKEYGDKSEDPTNFLRNKEKEKIEFKKGTKFKLPLDLVKKMKTDKNVKTV